MNGNCNGKILVVDDNEDILAYLEVFLTSKGYEVTTSSSGEKAIEVAKKITPDLIILDIKMPKMDGYQTCEQLRSNGLTRLIPIIFISAESRTEESVIKGLNLGGNDYVTKPFNDEELIARIESLIRTHSEYKIQIIDEKLKALFEIIGSLSHKINQPLTGILGNAELILRSMSEDDKNYKRVQNIHTSAQKIVETMQSFREIRHYELKDYLNRTIFLIDVEKSSKNNNS